MSMLWRKRNCIFIHINKCGGSSIQQALSGTYVREHRSLEEHRSVLGKRGWEACFKFAFVRNPWDRMVSLYHYRLQKGRVLHNQSFEEWIQDVWNQAPDKQHEGRYLHWNQVDWISIDGKIAVDFVGKVENMEKDFQHVCQQLGVSASLPTVNTTQHKNYRTYYNDHTRQIVAKRFQRDIDAFGYVF